MPKKKKTGTHKSDEAEKRMVKRGPVALWDSHSHSRGRFSGCPATRPKREKKKTGGGEGGPNTGSGYGEETISSARPFWAAIVFPFKLHDCQFGRRFVAVMEGGDSVEWHGRDFLEVSVGKARKLIRVDERSDHYENNNSNNRVACTKLDGISWRTEPLAER